MKEPNFIERLFNKLKRALYNRYGVKDRENSTAIKKEMCKKAVLSGVCPHVCDICAWNTLE